MPQVQALEHERTPFVTDPYEWTFSMLKDAGLVHLDLLLAALGADLTMKDGYAYNLAFVGARPVFIPRRHGPAVLRLASAGHAEGAERRRVLHRPAEGHRRRHPQARGQTGVVAVGVGVEAHQHTSTPAPAPTPSGSSRPPSWSASCRVGAPGWRSTWAATTAPTRASPPVTPTTWSAGRERAGFFDRARPDAVLALALLHHLAITGNVPLAELVDWLQLSKVWQHPGHVATSAATINRLGAEKGLAPGITRLGPVSVLIG